MIEVRHWKCQTNPMPDFSACRFRQNSCVFVVDKRFRKMWQFHVIRLFPVTFHRIYSIMNCKEGMMRAHAGFCVFCRKPGA